jgi:hypothetical protein
MELKQHRRLLLKFIHLFIAKLMDISQVPPDGIPPRQLIPIYWAGRRFRMLILTTTSRSLCVPLRTSFSGEIFPAIAGASMLATVLLFVTMIPIALRPLARTLNWFGPA